MKSTFSSHVLSQLTSSGFSVTKDLRENQWELRDGEDVVARSRSLGDLCRRVAKDLGIEWKYG